MSNAQRNTAASTAAAENSFMTLSQVYLSSIEDIASLNLKAAREALEDYASAAKALSAPTAGTDYAKVLSDLGQPMFDKALTHSRNMCELMAKTQNEMSAVFKNQLTHPQMAWAGAVDLNELSGMFTKGFEQLSASASDNSKAATDASAKAIAETASSAKKAA